MVDQNWVYPDGFLSSRPVVLPGFVCFDCGGLSPFRHGACVTCRAVAELLRIVGDQGAHALVSGAMADIYAARAGLIGN